MSAQIEMLSFSDRDKLVTELVHTIEVLLSTGITQNGRATLAVSGGSTPVQLFECLSLSDIAWQSIDIILVDERWVEPGDPDSNENLVRMHLLKNRAAKASFTGMKNSARTASEGEAECAADLQKIQRPFDVLILGLGGDGHTASFFPGAVKLPQATDMESGKICVSIVPVTAPHERMTLTLPVILESKRIFLHITGQNKKDVLEKACAAGPSEEMPIRFILRPQEHTKAHGQLSVYWAQ